MAMTPDSAPFSPLSPFSPGLLFDASRSSPLFQPDSPLLLGVSPLATPLAIRPTQEPPQTNGQPIVRVPRPLPVPLVQPSVTQPLVNVHLDQPHHRAFHLTIEENPDSTILGTPSPGLIAHVVDVGILNASARLNSLANGCPPATPRFLIDNNGEEGPLKSRLTVSPLQRLRYGNPTILGLDGEERRTYNAGDVPCAEYMQYPDWWVSPGVQTKRLVVEYIAAHYLDFPAHHIRYSVKFKGLEYHPWNAVSATYLSHTEGAMLREYQEKAGLTNIVRAFGQLQRHRGRGRGQV